MRGILLGVLTLAVFGSWGCGPGSFKGTVRGRGLNVEDAVFYQSDGSRTGVQTVEVVLSDRANLCADLRAGVRRKSSGFLDIILFRTQDGGPVSPDQGRYTISGNAGRIGTAFFLPLDADCDALLSQDEALGAGGTVQVDELRGVPGGRIEGSFELIIGAQAEQVTGNFSADWCDLSTPPTSVTCQ